MSSSDRKKILILLICMVTGSAVGVFITILSMSLLIDIYLYIAEGIRLDMHTYNLEKLFKVSSCCGCIGGGGCWLLYYRNYRKNK